jgi:hypothetical protein
LKNKNSERSSSGRRSWEEELGGAIGEEKTGLKTY